MKLYISLILLLVFCFSVSAKTKPEIEIPLRFDRYYDYDDMNAAIRKLAQAYPEICKLHLVGKSDEGRDILALIINNPKTGSVDDKPGVWVDGNIHGNEVQAGEVCLYFAQYLLCNNGSNPEITRVLNKNAYFIVPVVNVDGRYHFFNDANTMNSNRSVRRAKDDDYDGLVDEDGYDDLDGDGNICQMRIKDPFGKWKTDPKDPRILVRVKDGEKGEYSLLGLEGIDNDNDGLINEDKEGYVDPNRNWPGSWQPNYIQRGAGDFPLSSASTKAVSEFFGQHPNIIMSWYFHNSGGMFLAPPGRKGEMISKGDANVYKYLGLKAERMVPGYRYMTALELYPTYGGTIDFAYRIYGSFAFVGELFQSQTETFLPNKKAADLNKNQQRLKFNDHVVHGDLYKEWTPYKHPLYGDIEIGGWKKMSTRLPHTFMLTDLVHRNASAVLFSAAETPEVELEVIKSESIGNNLFRINIQLSNKGMIPSMSGVAITDKIHPKDVLEISGKKVIAGGLLLNKYTNEVKFKEHKPDIQYLSVPGKSKVDYQFIVEGKGEINFSYKSLKASDKTITFSIK